MSRGLADARTFETLDFAAVRDRLSAAARTERGRRYAALLEPSGDFGAVRVAQSLTSQVRELVATGMHALPALDTAAWTQRAAAGMSLTAAELRAIADALSAASAAINKTREAPPGPLETLTAPHRDLSELRRAIENAIDERAAVLDRASPALMRIRKQLATSQNEARDRVAALLRSAKCARAIQDAVVTIRDGRFVLPIKAEFSGEVPGIVHDTSSSGQTLFVEPLAALEVNNRVRTLRIDEEREVARVLEDLSRRTGGDASQIETNVDILAHLDLLIAKAQLAQAMDAAAPQLVDDAALGIAAGRHPLLDGRAVPQSLTLDRETRLLVISGPNMGGKTVALKMVGLFVTMVYAGMQIPASPETRIGRFGRIFTDIGDEQSIADNTSTFSAHLRRMREIFEAADDRSLVLVDEIGGGTEPTSGAALAVAMLEKLIAVGACGIVTTHATELKLFAHETAGVANASVRFDPRTFAPTYQLDVGLPGQSLAFPLARTLGIPPSIIARAEALLSGRDRDYEQALADLSEQASRLQEERETLARDRAHVERLQGNLRSRADALERERRSFAEAAQTRLTQTLRDFSQQLGERDRVPRKVTRGQSELLNKTLEDMRRDLGISDVPAAPTANAGPLAAGDLVRVGSLGQDASVISDNGDTVLVALGALRTVVRRADVRRIGAAVAPVSDAGSGERRLQSSLAAAAELDVRGKRYVDAEPLVDRWIDEALIAGHSPLRLIHGKGTGMLGRGLQEFLRAHPAVSAVRYGDENEGGSGVTVFELR